ncbi:unnamed protein product [Hydatigera taeniaeformis]|uniref:Uncharacterized protein n=1 Tax=Hydatigena taeniaeformis TaxID=6205 RepID=A0A3P7FAT8_HYDTA|nr:unnamed protein product [Hydatigera taeniaeformis]
MCGPHAQGRTELLPLLTKSTTPPFHLLFDVGQNRAGIDLSIDALWAPRMVGSSSWTLLLVTKSLFIKFTGHPLLLWRSLYYLETSLAFLVELMVE